MAFPVKIDLQPELLRDFFLISKHLTINIAFLIIAFLRNNISKLL